MAQHVITVAPTAEGWTVRNGQGAPLVFESSAQALWSARKVGEATAAGGVSAEVRVLDRNGAEAGRYHCPADRELELN